MRFRFKQKIKIPKSFIKSKKTFKEQIESVSRKAKTEVCGFKKPREKFIDETIKADKISVIFDDKPIYSKGEYTQIHTHFCDPKVYCESTPGPFDFLGWVDNNLTTGGKMNRAVVSSIHFKTGKELGRLHILFKKDSLDKQLKGHIYDAYLEFAKKNGRQPLPLERFNADLFFLQESGKVRRYLNTMIEKDFDFETRLKNSKTKDLREIFLDIEKKWGIKIRPFSHPGHNFNYKTGSFY